MIVIDGTVCPPNSDRLVCFINSTCRLLISGRRYCTCAHRHTPGRDHVRANPFMSPIPSFISTYTRSHRSHLNIRGQTCKRPAYSYRDTKAAVGFVFHRCLILSTPMIPPLSNTNLYDYIIQPLLTCTFKPTHTVTPYHLPSCSTYRYASDMPPPASTGPDEEQRDAADLAYERLTRDAYDTVRRAGE
jgi:hypothetical protein